MAWKKRHGKHKEDEDEEEEEEEEEEDEDDPNPPPPPEPDCDETKSYPGNAHRMVVLLNERRAIDASGGPRVELTKVCGLVDVYETNQYKGELHNTMTCIHPTEVKGKDPNSCVEYKYVD